MVFCNGLSAYCKEKCPWWVARTTRCNIKFYTSSEFQVLSQSVINTRYPNRKRYFLWFYCFTFLGHWGLSISAFSLYIWNTEAGDLFNCWTSKWSNYIYDILSHILIFFHSCFLAWNFFFRLRDNPWRCLTSIEIMPALSDFTLEVIRFGSLRIFLLLTILMKHVSWYFYGCSSWQLIYSLKVIWWIFPDVYWICLCNWP